MAPGRTQQLLLYAASLRKPRRERKNVSSPQQERVNDLPLDGLGWVLYPFFWLYMKHDVTGGGPSLHPLGLVVRDGLPDFKHDFCYLQIFPTI